MLKTSESIGALPLPIGVIRNQNSSNLDLHHYKMRDKQAEILADGIQDMEDTERICLSHNGISDNGTQKILDNLNQTTFDLDISYNNFSTKLLIHLVAFLCTDHCHLQVLNMEGNRLGDQAIKIFFSSCNSQKIKLKSLNLSRNSLSSSICPLLNTYISCNQQLYELYLHWNRIRAEGGKLIFQAIIENPTIKVLDLSHNALGKTVYKKNCFLDTFSDMIKSNKILLHLDLSFNFFDYDQSKIISDALAYNHSLYGFHFAGNVGIIDGYGYLRLQVSENFLNQQQQHFQQHNFYRINSLQIVQMNNYNVYQNCWICEGWVENIFTYINLESGPQCQDPPNLHLDLSNYMPMQMKLIEDNQYELKVMTPPQKKIKYFFTVDGNHIAAYDQKRIQNSQQITVQWLNKLVVIKDLEKLNQIESSYSKKSAYSDYFSIYSTPPRNLIDLIFNEKIAEYEGWSYQNSIFRNYKKDDCKLLDEAFEHDYNQSRLSKFFDQNETLQQNLKALLRQNYELIKTLYKYYSSFSPQREVWCISQNIFTEFLQTSYLLDGKYLTLSSCDFIFIATNAFNKEIRQKLNPERCIVRHQFMEIIVRLADEQYYKSYICEDLTQAIQYFLNHLSTFSEIYINNEQQWRNQFLWTESVDSCLKFYRKALQMLFDKFLSRKTMLKPQLLLQDFKNIIIASQIHKDIDSLKEKDVNIIFNMSLQTSISELTSERHLEMNFYEFIEAICRIAEIISHPPFQWEEDQAQEQIDFQGFPLHIKIEALIQILARKSLVTQTEKQIKLDVELPQKSIFEEEIAQLKSFTEILTPRIIIKKKIPSASVQFLQNRFKEIVKQNEISINQRKENSQNQTVTGVRKNSVFNTALQKRTFKTQSQGQESLAKLLSKPVDRDPIPEPESVNQGQKQLSSTILQRLTGQTQTNQTKTSKFASSGSILSQRKSIILTQKLQSDEGSVEGGNINQATLNAPQFNFDIQEEEISQNDTQNIQKLQI